jgi:hypothetical protein
MINESIEVSFMHSKIINIYLYPNIQGSAVKLSLIVDPLPRIEK